MNHVHTWIRGEKWTLGNAEQAFQKVLYKANLIVFLYNLQQSNTSSTIESSAFFFELSRSIARSYKKEMKAGSYSSCDYIKM